MKVDKIYVISDKAGFDDSAIRNLNFSNYLEKPFKVTKMDGDDIEEIKFLDETLQNEFDVVHKNAGYDYIISSIERKYFSEYTGAQVLKEGFDALFDAGYSVRIISPNGSYRAFEDKATMDQFVQEFANTVNYQALEREMNERHRIERAELVAKFNKA